MTCSPYPNPAFVERTDEVDQGGWLHRVIKSVADKGVGQEPRNLRQQMADYRALVGQMMPMNFDELTQYYIDQGWMVVDRAASAAKGEDVIKVGFRGEWIAKTKEVRNVLAATKTYLETVGGGINEAAQQFTMRVDAGEDALDSARFFASQVQHVSRFGQFVLGLDQQAGRLLQMQALRKDPNLMKRVMANSALRSAELEEATWEATEGFLESVARKMSSNNDALQQEAIGDLLDVAKRIKFANDPRDALRITKSIDLASNVFNEIWFNGLLSSPATLITNALGFTWAIARPASQYLVSQAYRLAQVPFGQEQALQSSMEAAASLNAMYGAVQDAWRLGWKAARSDHSIYQTHMGRTEFNPAQAINFQNAQETAAKFNASLPDDWEGSINFMGHFVRLPSKALLGADEFTKHLVVRGEVAKRGIRRALKRPNVDLGDQASFQQAIAEEMELAFKGISSPDVRNEFQVRESYEYAMAIRDEALYSTFQQQNGWATAFNSFLQTPVIGPLMRPWFPFVRTPLNILKEGFIDSTPIGLLIKSQQLWVDTGGSINPMKAVLLMQDKAMKDFAEEPGQAFQAAGQMALTMSLAAALYGQVMSGNATGGGPGRWHPDRANAWKYQKNWLKMQEENGRVPYAIAGVPFSRFGEPVALVLRMVADVGEYSSYMSQDEQDASMFAIAGIMASGLYQASFLQGLNTLTDAVFGDDPGGVRKVAAMQSWAATLTPFGGMMNYVDKAFVDPYKRAYGGASMDEATESIESAWGEWMARLVDRLPGLGKAPMMFDQITGEPVLTNPGNGPYGLNPAQIAIPILPRGVESADKTWTFVLRFMNKYTEYTPGNIDLNRAEQQQLNRLMAKAEIGGMTFQQWIARFSQRADVKQFIEGKGVAAGRKEMSFALQEEFNRMKMAYGQQALFKLQSVSPNLQAREAKFELLTEAKKGNDRSGAQTLLEEIGILEKEARSQPLQEFLLP